ncbi:T9SS type A sorting domain-containing protein [Gaetbulibacter sp. M235]|uniref:T9SS type A sorting domain-containing protein n=1 Tax=Gaetbulibacter sp. M235 TaxID=3126510 RepID=UPI00374EE8C2
MKKIYLLLFLMTAFILNAQTKVTYPQRVANYDTFFSAGGGKFNDGTDNFGMWANGGGTAKQSVAWRSFTEDGTTTGIPSTMAVGDSFTITVSATRAWVQIGLALLSSPSSKVSWADRINNYAVQVNLNRVGGVFMPWEIVSAGGAIDASAIVGSTSYADYKFKFTLDTENTMTVSINDEAETFNITLNNTNITGYSIYLADDWNGSANANIYWKPATEYTYAITLSNKSFNFNNTLFIFPNPVTSTFKTDIAIHSLKIYDITGKLVKEFNGKFGLNQEYNISDLSSNIYFLKTLSSSGNQKTTKLIKL